MGRRRKGIIVAAFQAGFGVTSFLVGLMVGIVGGLVKGLASIGDAIGDRESKPEVQPIAQSKQQERKTERQTERPVEKTGWTSAQRDAIAGLQSLGVKKGEAERRVAGKTGTAAEIIKQAIKERG